MAIETTTKLTTLTSSDRELVRNVGVKTLPDNPSAKGFNAAEIKAHYERPVLMVHDELSKAIGEVNTALAQLDSNDSELSSGLDTKQPLLTAGTGISSDDLGNNIVKVTLLDTFNVWSQSQVFTGGVSVRNISATSSNANSFMGVINASGGISSSGEFDSNGDAFFYGSLNVFSPELYLDGANIKSSVVNDLYFNNKPLAFKETVTALSNPDWASVEASI